MEERERKIQFLKDIQSGLITFESVKRKDQLVQVETDPGQWIYYVNKVQVTKDEFNKKAAGRPLPDIIKFT